MKLILLSLVLLTSCVRIHLSERDILHPEKIIDINDYPWLKERYIEVSEESYLHMLVSRNEGQQHTVFYLKGNSGNMFTPRVFRTIEWLHTSGFQVVAIDYRGFGKSTGSPSLSKIRDDVFKAFEYLPELDLAGELIVYGYSLGGWAAANIAAEYECVPFIFEAPAVNPTRVAELRLDDVGVPRRWFVHFSVDEELNRINTHELMASVNCPVLILAGKNDNIFPSVLAYELYDKVTHDRKQVIVLENAGHGNLVELQTEKMTNILLEFIEVK